MKSCAYCGKIHDKKMICEERKKAEENRGSRRKNTASKRFRDTNRWKEKSKQIRSRDNYMCVCCMSELEGTVRKYNTESLEVHHIIPIEEDYDKRLDDGNLITVCRTHHEMCESGEISRKKQKELIGHDEI